MELEIRFVQDKETPGTVRYAEQNKDGISRVPTVYIRKSAFPDGKYPSAMTATFKFEED